MKNLKKITALGLSAAMVMSMVPATLASADEETGKEIPRFFTSSKTPMIYTSSLESFSACLRFRFSARLRLKAELLKSIIAIRAMA